MTAKEYLSQARGIKLRLGAMADQLAFLKSAAEHITPTLSDMPKSPSSTGRKTEDAIIRVLGFEEQMQAQHNKLAEINAVISAVADPTLQAVLAGRYMGGKRWSDIAAALHYSLPRIYEIHRAALAEVEKNLQITIVNHSKS